MDNILYYETFAQNLIDNYNLVGWKFCWNKSKRSKSTLGVCDYSEKTITISYNHATNQPKDEVKDTILHEVAHALTEGHGHDKVWKNKCIEIGAMPERCYIHGSMERQYKGVCPSCGDTLISYKKKTACSSCYFENYMNVHRKNGNGVKINYVYVWEEII